MSAFSETGDKLALALKLGGVISRLKKAVSPSSSTFDYDLILDLDVSDPVSDQVIVREKHLHCGNFMSYADRTRRIK